MKEKFIILIIILSAFTSCDKENNEPSCLSIEKAIKTASTITLKVNKVKEIEFEILNDCDANYTIFDYDISGDIKNPRIEGLTINKQITSKKLTFKVIVTPITTGYKTITFSIRTENDRSLFHSVLM